MTETRLALAVELLREVNTAFAFTRDPNHAALGMRLRDGLAQITAPVHRLKWLRRDRIAPASWIGRAECGVMVGIDVRWGRLSIAEQSESNQLRKHVLYEVDVIPSSENKHDAFSDEEMRRVVEQIIALPLEISRGV